MLHEHITPVGGLDCCFHRVAGSYEIMGCMCVYIGFDLYLIIGYILEYGGIYFRTGMLLVV